ncbi:MAG: AraC family transcriptional regulator [Lachnospiraceae bacterium]|nr:AraC family transcriptional regulator [Lachnospiraceae bacterium]MDD3615729.1 AraC family transcriptional regulator [Lachnospiraceae bacterium]
MSTNEIHSMKKNISGIIFDRQEFEIPHNPYEQEVRELDSIRKGDRNLLLQSWKETYPGQVGTLADNPLRQAKNVAICVITLSSRAAIEGGMLPEEAFSMVDACVMQVEKMSDSSRIEEFQREAQLEFLEGVIRAQQKSERNELVERTKNYIFQNLHKSIIIGEIGKHMGVNSDYLSTLFHKVEGCTIQQYIQKEKVHLAENMLRYSDYSIQEIASYLLFCSQSHFGQAFKKEVGMTPSQYRKKFGVR